MKFRAFLACLGLLSGCATAPPRTASFTSKVDEASLKWSQHQGATKYEQALVEEAFRAYNEALLNYVELINRLTVPPVP